MGGDFTKRTIWLACLMLVLSTTFALGQGIVTGSIAGTVVDPQKAVVAGAKVDARNVGTNVDFKTTTNDQGFFSIRSMPPGTYAVLVDAPNFKHLDIANVVVNTGVTTDMGSLALALGATAETITVEAAAPLIETASAQGGATFSGSTTQNLPLNGGFDQLMLFIPGVVTAGNAGIFANSNGASFSSNGQRDRSNTFQIDGQFNNDTGVTGPAIFFSNQDALQEVQAVTNNFGVEYGRTSGSTVNYVTKSGSNNFHGSAFEYYTGNWADSLTNQEKQASPITVARFTENRWGGVLGGPIVSNKIFFFTSFLQDTQKASFGPATTKHLTPTPGGLTTLAGCFGANNPAVSLLNTIGPFGTLTKQGNPQPFGTHESLTVSNGVTSCPSVDFAGITRTVPAPANTYEATGRVDFAASPRDQLFVRYLFHQFFLGGPNNSPAQFGDNAEGSAINAIGRDQQAALDWTRNLSTHLVNQVRFSYVREVTSFPADTFTACLPGELGGLCPPFFRMTGTIENIGLGVNAPQAGLTNNSQWQDNASWQHGRHLVKFGGEYDRQRAPNIFLPNANGRYSFLGFSDPLSAFNAFLQQAPVGASGVTFANGDHTQPFKEQDVDLYLGDDWRIKDNLTLNLGIRWEFNQQAINRLADISHQREQNPATALWPTVDPKTGLPIPLSLREVPQVPNRYNHFAPSFGFAWTPHMLKALLGENRTVIRGGFRIAYNPAFYNIFLNAATAAPFVNLATFACPAPCAYAPTAAGVLAALSPDITAPINPGRRVETRVAPTFTNPYAEEWTLGVEREISGKISAEVRYVGTHTVHEFQTVNGNPQLCADNTAGCVGGLLGDFPKLVPAGVTPCETPNAPGFASGFANCNFRLLRIRDNGATARYNSLQSQLKFRNWHGLSGGVAYTFSKTMDNASEIFSTYGPSAIAGPQDPFCTARCEWGLSAIDYPHNVAIFWNYDLPFGRGTTGSALGRVLGGWALGGTYKYTSGQLWTPFEDPNTSSFCNDSFNNQFFSASSCRPFPANFAAPASAVGLCMDATMPDCGLVDFTTGLPTSKSKVHWIINDDTAAKFFGTPFSPMRRNPGARGQPVNTMNLNLIKNTRISERVNLKLEANVYNVMNHMWLGVPSADITSDQPCFGLFTCNDSGGVQLLDSGSGPPNAVANGLAQRRVILGAHIIF